MNGKQLRTFVVRWGWLVGVAVVVSVGAALVVTLLRTPVYEATAEVAPAPNANDPSGEVMETERQIVASDVVRQRARDDLGLRSLPPRAEVRIVDGSYLLSISVRHTNRTSARRLADATADAYVGVRDGVPVVVNRASEPREPVHPNAARSVGLAAALGVLVGLGGAAVAFRSDDMIRSADDLAGVDGLEGLDVLGTIPMEPPPDNRPISVSEPDVEAVEDYRSATVLLRGRAEPGAAAADVLLVTSAGRREGRTTVASNLAVTMARSGARTLLIDANVRIPQLHEVFGVDRGPGFSDLLTGSIPDVEPYRLDVGDGIPLDLVTAGSLDAGVVDLVAGPAAPELIRRLADGYDLAVVDASSARLLPDPLSLSAAADQVVVVVGLGRVERSELALTVSRFRRAGAPVAGVLLNTAPLRG